MGREKGRPILLETGLAKRLTKSSEWLLSNILKQNTEISSSSLAMLTRNSGYSIDKIRTQVGYEPKINLVEGMLLTEKWLRDTKFL
jgi:nucleoside-diphosphate-sugar epimerase